MRAVERLELRAIDRLDRCLALAGARVRVLAEQRAAERPIREELRRRLALRNSLQVLLLQNRDLVGGQRRVHRDVGDQVDEPRRELGEAADRQRRVVLRNRG